MADSYRLDILSRARKALDDAIARLPTDKYRPTIDAMKQVLRRLETAPFDFGEELYDLKSLGLQVRLGISLPIAVHFGADRSNRIVIIQSVAVLE
jgi:hypothetical protein